MGDGKRHWRLRSNQLRNLLFISADELVELETATAELGRTGFDERAALLRDLGTKLGALLGPVERRRIEPDLEALMMAEGLAMRPGPRPRLEPGLLMTLRDAIKGGRVIDFRYAPEPRLAAAGILSWNQAQPSGKLTPGVELRGIADRSHKGGGGDHPDTRDRLKPPACLSGAMPGLQLLLKIEDLCLGHPQLLDQRPQGLTRQRRQTRVVAVFDHLDEDRDLRRALRDDHAELTAMPPERIDQHGSLAHQQVARPVQHQNRLLFRRLHRRKPHGRAHPRFADRFRIRGIVLVRLDEGVHILRWDQSHRVPERP